jgi:hypothetical protein
MTIVLKSNMYVVVSTGFRRVIQHNGNVL